MPTCVAPGLSDARNFPSPSVTARTALSSESMVMATSAPRTAPSMVGEDSAPSSFPPDRFQVRTSNPCATRLAAMARPIWPSPRNATFNRHPPFPWPR